MSGSERPRISLRQIEGFQLASEHLSFSRAATQMGVSQSAFSQLIREMELQLGVDLFDRTTRKVVLTAAGEAMQLKTRRGLDAINDACQEAIAIGRADRGHIRVGALSSLAIGIVTRTLGRLRTDFPGITVSLQEEDNDVLVDLVGAAAVDLAVCSQVAGKRELSFEHLLDDELMLVTPRRGRLARQQNVAWTDLAEEPLVFSNRGTSTREHASAALEAHGIPSRVDVEVTSMATAIAMVRAGFGSAFVSRIGLQDLSAEGVRILPITRPPLRRIGVYRRTDRQPSAAAAKFARLLQQEAVATQEKLDLQAWRL